MTKDEKSTIAEGLQRIIADLAVIASLFEESKAEARNKDSPAVEPARESASDTETAQEPAPETACTYEEIRAVLAEKTRNGYRAEIKALLTRHGVRQLSEITDPREYAQLRTEAEAIGNG